MLTEKENSLKHYYKILGLEEGASLEQVTARWFELKKEFQLNPRKDDEAHKTIKEINEAYKMLKGSVPFFVEFDVRRAILETGARRRAKNEKTRRKIIISSGILAICLIIGAFIFILERPPVTTRLTTTTQDDPNRNIQRSIEKIVPLPPPESQTPLKISKVEPQEPSKADMPEIATPVPATPLPLKPAPPVEVAKVVPQEPSKITVPPPPSGLATEREVRQFFESYVNRYNSKSIEGFISFFSPKAIQNQKDNLEKIRRTYDNFFDQMESVQYQIAINKIEPQQNSVEVRGQYELEGVVAKGRKKQNWKGQVRWVLVRENGALKILSLDYQPQQ